MSAKPEVQRPREKSRIITKIEPGFYTMKLAKRGPVIPAQIELIEGRFVVSQSGERLSETYAADEAEDLVAATVLLGEANKHPLVCIHLYADRVSEERYLRLMSVIERARKNCPNHPILHPYLPVDLAKTGPLW